MAEARREIVSALKLHRAAMKQASENKQLGPDVRTFGPEAETFGPEEAKLKSRRNPRIYASNSYVDNIIAYSPGLYSPYSWPVSSIAPPLFVQENLDFALPSQTLGLNLNLQDFNNHFHSSTNPGSSIYSSSSPSTSSSSAPSAAAEEIPYMGGAPPDPAAAEIGSIGDRDLEIEDFVNSPFDEVMEFPAWMNANESCLQLVDGFCSDEYFQNPALPCMDIEEIEGMDGDCFSASWLRLQSHRPITLLSRGLIMSRSTRVSVRENGESMSRKYGFPTARARERIWLGSYHTAEKAARALFCLRGRHVKFNFPDDPSEISGGPSLGSAEIQAVAQQYANSYGHGSSYDQPEGGDAEFRARAMGSDWAGPLDLIDDWSFLDMLDVNGGGGNKNKSGCVLDYGLFLSPVICIYHQILQLGIMIFWP
ncbi:hypothetical protein DH2020_036492 [Rehmannia glutinosa]|uniref:AP2/ERF domain-containing protein n=1 Tax=Rehmannia glutinosa TaxID=99300 RepID=A0ABR0V418_REHGL